jgi:hypothetical protein
VILFYDPAKTAEALRWLRGNPEVSAELSVFDTREETDAYAKARGVGRVIEL